MNEIAKSKQGKVMLAHGKQLLEKYRELHEEAKPEDSIPFKAVIKFIKEEWIKPLEIGSIDLKKSEKREYI